MDGRDFVLPDDVKALAMPALVHRLIVRPESAFRGYTAGRILQDLLRTTPLDIGDLSDVPREASTEPAASPVAPAQSEAPSTERRSAEGLAGSARSPE